MTIYGVLGIEDTPSSKVLFPSCSVCVHKLRILKCTINLQKVCQCMKDECEMHICVCNLKSKLIIYG